MITMTTGQLAMLLLAAMGLGAVLTVAWQRGRVHVDRLTDGTYVLRLGRAVAGRWPNSDQADHHADAVRRQIGGHR